ncbi:MerR family DNA-binding transcriptional regulator [Aurantiacibacter xanthus]|uniref:MerR family DNA-binding transcriptional regulator n=1 Tax=Aurantiacibacter xanthus TaxID=1784712 RepID=A0A3A1P5T7_9SPHN|nr:MerR family DNA-binding transcriptional regulator [Aurantiacibacter xanthus]RIV88646.1 MerR family DNA-binding transcriptional regulator [Aurantiacibacter xanthus]
MTDVDQADDTAIDPAAEEGLKSIAEASEELGVTQRTLRFYEDKGLIQPRRVGAMRVYSRREMGRMQLILRGKRLGFSIREIGEFLSLYDTEHGKESQMRHLLQQVADRLEELRHQRDAIDKTIVELEAIEQQARERLPD